ncbi:MAG: hypothetical protein FWF05_02020 [Oscillospiraceae bacterium]|nr:hypothetical protein [Oscillospiraceae bacterium]
MKKSMLKRTLAVLLAAVMAFSVFAVMGSAAPGGSFGEAILVTGDFSAVTVADDYPTFYKFVPNETGWYEIYSEADDNCDPYINLLDSDGNYLAYSDDNGIDLNFYLPCYLTAGETYYFLIRAFGLLAAEFDVKIGFLGAIQEAEITSYPAKNTFIMDYDCGVYGDDDEDYYFHLSLYELEVKLTFDGGKVITLGSWEIYNKFEISHDKPVIGTNEIRFKSGNETVFTLDVEVIENPVKSIEVVKLPDRTDYTYRLDGYTGGTLFNRYFQPYIFISGMEIKINYTNGTSEIVKVDDFDYYYWSDNNFYIEHNGYDINIYVESGTVGKNNVYVAYLGRYTTFEINVVKPTIMQRFFLFLMDIAGVFRDINYDQYSIWNRIYYLLRDTAREIGR